MAETIKIMVSSGHSSTDPGAVKYVCERDEVWDIANMVAEELNKNWNVRAYREKWSDTMYSTVNKSNAIGCDFYFEFHENAGGGDGAECIIHGKANQWMADEIKKAFDECGQNWRRTIIDSGYYVLNQTNAKAMIVECAFVDNKKDIKDWDEPHEKRKMAKALAKHIAIIVGAKKRFIKQKSFKVCPRYDLLVRAEASTKSKKLDKKCYQNHVYTIVEKKGNRGRIKTGGWITISSKYVKKL